jgi:hypothetical protein
VGRSKPKRVRSVFNCLQGCKNVTTAVFPFTSLIRWYCHRRQGSIQSHSFVLVEPCMTYTFLNFWFLVWWAISINSITRDLPPFTRPSIHARNGCGIFKVSPYYNRHQLTCQPSLAAFGKTKQFSRGGVEFDSFVTLACRVSRQIHFFSFNYISNIFCSSV